jgi:hypothetical protein
MAFIVSNSQPPNGALGDEWYNPVENITYKMVPRKGTNPEWHGYGNTAANVLIATSYTQTNTVVTITDEGNGNPYGDPYWNSVTLMLDGNDSTTPIFNSDASINRLGVNIPPGSDVKPTNFTPYLANGYYSTTFDGISDCIQVADTVDTQLGTGDFTIEAWICVGFDATNTRQIFSKWVDQGYQLAVYANNQLGWQVFSQDAGAASPAKYIPPSTWTHVAWTRSGTRAYLFVNGRLASNAGVTLAANGGGATIGAQNDGSNSFLEKFNGQISNLRIVKGTALYTADFVPSTTPLTAVANTSLLACATANITNIITSNANVTLTPIGTPKILQSSPFDQTPIQANVTTLGSAFFDGLGDYLTVNANNALAFGTGDFTIEFWVYPNAISRQDWIDIDNGSGNRILIFGNSSNVIYSSAGVDRITGSTFRPGSWIHIAVVRMASSSNLYINGNQSGITYTDTRNYPAQLLTIGKDNAGSTHITGYIADLRIVKGTAIYTGSFTPPTAPLTAVENTSLLTLQYNGSFNSKNTAIIDEGSFGAQLTRFGNVALGTFTPNTPNTLGNYYIANVNGGSAYFDGAGDYLQDISNNRSNSAYIFPGDFTLEAWIYPEGLSTTRSTIFSIGSKNINRYLVQLNDTGQLVVEKWGNAAVTMNAAITGNAWSHVAIVRSNTVVSAYVNGVWGSVSQVLPGNIGNGGFSLGYDIGGATSNAFYGYMSGVRLAKQAIYTVGGNKPPAIPFKANASIIDTKPTANTSNSVYFNGASFIRTSSNVEFALSTSDFTIEAWVNRTSFNNSNSTILDFRQSGAFSQLKPTLQFADSSGIRFISNGAIRISSTGLEYGNTWHHVALVRDNGFTRLYVNGITQSTVYVDLNDYGANAQSITIGAAGDNNSFSNVYFTGYITNLRIIKGLAIYTQNFTPDTRPLTPFVVNALPNCTSILALQGTHTDNSGRGITLTTTGANSATVANIASPFSPFGSFIPAVTPANTSLLLNFTSGAVIDYRGQTNVETANVGLDSNSAPKFNKAIGPFRRSDTFITIPHDTKYDLTETYNPFTIEYWIYPTNFAGLPANSFVITKGASTTTFPQWVSKLNSDGNVFFNLSTSTNLLFPQQITLGNISLSGNAWNHVAHTKNGNQILTTWINGRVASMTQQTVSVGADTIRPLVIGSQPGGTTAGFDGYLENIRITKGVCRYTRPFTPNRANTFLGYFIPGPASNIITSVSNVSIVPPPAAIQPASSVRYLVVAGGGAGGGGNGGGGGGGGGVLTGNITVSSNTTYTITIGAGGNNTSVPGNDSSFGSLVAIGGGGGSSESAPNTPGGRPGGSGGGGGSSTPGVSHPGGVGYLYSSPEETFYTPTGAQGYPGGAGFSSIPTATTRHGGGGGGAGQKGAEAMGIGGSSEGGNGMTSDIAGTGRWIAAAVFEPIMYGGGGGGGAMSTTRPNAGGLGGGGKGGGSVTTSGNSGNVNTGGGGGGGGNSFPGGAGTGGSGIVIISYPTAVVLAGTSGSNVLLTEVNGQRVHSFYSSGTITF